MDLQSNTNDTTDTDDVKDKNILTGFVFDFYKQNILWVIVTIVVLFVTSPLEMIVLSNLFSSFTSSINKLDYGNSISILWKIAFLYIIIDVIYMINSYYDKISYPKMEKFIRFKLIDLIFKNIEVNYDHENISNIILRLLQIPNVAVSCTQNFIYWMFTFCITVFSILAYILYINLEIGGIMIILFCIFCLTYYYVLLKIKNKSAERDKEEKVLTTHVDDVLSNSLSVIACKKLKMKKNT